MPGFVLPKKGLARLFKAEFQTWADMRKRCHGPKCKSYGSHGGRGIKVCKRWRSSFRNFLLDMGKRPSAEYSLDRINNDWHYCPSNCRWATRSQQQRNTRRNHMITHNGETQCITEWAKRLNVTSMCILGRLRKGWSVEKTLTTRPHEAELANRMQATINGITKNVNKWIEQLGMPYYQVYARIKVGWTPEKALTTPIRKYTRKK